MPQTCPYKSHPWQFQSEVQQPLPLDDSPLLSDKDITTIPVTIEKRIPDDFLMTSYQLCRLLLDLPVEEYVPKKYENKVKLEIKLLL